MTRRSGMRRAGRAAETVAWFAWGGERDDWCCGPVFSTAPCAWLRRLALGGLR